MTNNERDLEKQEDVKADRTRRLLKWAIVLSVVALLAIVAVAIPMALKVLPGDDDDGGDGDVSKSAANNAVNSKNPTDIFEPLQPLEPLTPVEATVPPSRPSPAEPSAAASPPTVAPTVVDSPTSAPVPEPTGVPTRTPAPTGDLPSRAPTAAPTTLEPTPGPSLRPSSSPSTPSPTWTPIDPSYAFKLRLFWQRGFYWQESFDEVWHCVECVKCEEYGAGDGHEHGCKKYEDGQSSNCDEGDMFWIMGCDKRGAKFNLIENPGSGNQVRLDGRDLCIGRGARGPLGEWKRRILQAVRCDASDPNQLWAPFSSLSKFELRPLEHADRNEDQAECVSQLHHPKDEEVISMHGCKLSRIYETRYWEQY